MTVAQILMRLRTLGVELEVQGERLRYRPKSLVSPDMLEAMRVAKLELLDHLRIRDPTEAAYAIEGHEPDWFNHIDPIDREILLGPRVVPESCRYCGLRMRHRSNCPLTFDDELTRIDFGQHRGKLLCELPTDYLGWMLKSRDSIRSRPGLYQEMLREIHSRIEREPRAYVRLMKALDTLQP